MTGRADLVLLETAAVWLGATVLFLVVAPLGQLPNRPFHWTHLAAYLAIAALSGVPPLAGRGAVYAMSPDSPVGWALTGLLGVAQALFTAAALRCFWDNRADAPALSPTRTGALFVPLAGLLLLAPAAFSIAPQGWLLSILSTALGIGLAGAAPRWDAQLAPRLDHGRDLLQRLAAAGRTGGATAGDAMQQAIGLLEGEGALLWLLFLLVVFGLARL